MELTERQQREKAYYEQYAAKFDLDSKVDLAPVMGPLSGRERRPWNSYWRTYELPINQFHQRLISNDKENAPTLLDFGCGPGDNALRFASAGFNIKGFDISEGNITVSRNLFAKNQMSEQGEFNVGTAEKLNFADESFEAIVGIDILHHVDIPKAVREVKRVLKPGGIAIFREPIEVPFLDWIRNTALVRKFVPNAASLDAHITEDERKLNQVDVAILREVFPNMRMEKFLIFSRFDKFIRRHDQKNTSFLEKLDYTLCKLIPGFKNLAGGVIFILEK